MTSRLTAARRDLLWIIIATELGFGIRFFLATRSGMWRDETTTLAVVNLPTVLDVLSFLKLHESHPPLHFLMLRGWLSVFGNSEAAAVALSVVFGVLLIPVTYLVGRTLFDARVGRAGALLVAVSPALAFYSTVVRSYSLLTVLALVSVMFVVRALVWGRWKDWLGVGLTALALLYTHHWSWLLLGGELAASMIVLVRQGGWRERLPSIAATLTGITVGYALWLPAFLVQRIAAAHQPVPFSMRRGSVELLASIAFGLPPVALEIAAAAGIAYLLLTYRGKEEISGSAPNPLYPAATLVCLVAPLIATVSAALLSTTGDLLLVKCIQILTPLVLLGALSLLYRGFGKRAGHLVGGLVILNVTIGMGWLAEPIKSNARETARAVSARSRPSDLVVVSPYYYATSFDFYFPNRNTEINHPYIGRQSPSLYDFRQERLSDGPRNAIVRDTLRSAHQGSRRIWLVTECEWVRTMLRYRRTTPVDAASPMDVTWDLFDDLAALYGPPDTAQVKLSTRRGLEMFCPVIFGR